jgi:predicted solute-binding protein
MNNPVPLGQGIVAKRLGFSQILTLNKWIRRNLWAKAQYTVISNPALKGLGYS